MTREFIITKEFDRTWKELGLNDDDLRELEIYLCKNPDCGDTLEGTGGIKKFRWALEGRGKSGGARIIYLDIVFAEHIYLLTAFPKNEKANHQQIMLTQSIIYELLSTEIIEDCGLITNFYFKYITNINLNLKSELNPIKSSLFDCVMPAVNEEESELYENINNDNQLIDNSNRNLYIVRREENTILEEFEKNIENDDYLKKEKLIACFDSFLVNVYYKYLNKLSKK